MGDVNNEIVADANGVSQKAISQDEIAEANSKPVPPPPPPRPEDKPVMNPIYNANSPTATILFIRQLELLGSPGMNMHTDIFSSVSVQLASRVDTSDPSIWPGIIEDTNNDYIRSGKVKSVEDAILEGIPRQLRSVVYLKTAQVKTHIDKTSYTSLVKRARTSILKEDQALLESDCTSEDIKEILLVFTFCAREGMKDSSELVPSNFILKVTNIVAAIPGLSKQEILAILFKVNALNSRLHRDEFHYKLSRTLEEIVPDLFKHISKQGINLSEVYTSILHNIFDVVDDQDLLTKVFDFWLFEGFDFFHRLIGALFKEQQLTMIKLSGDELNDYFFSHDLLKGLSEETVSHALEVEPLLIKFENEFHLMSANAMSGNCNELSNLKEANDDLNFKIQEMKQKIDGLKKTQEEILGQETDYTTQLTEAKQKREQLLQRVKELQERYAHLTMKENLHNTIKANEDISRQNLELVEQITALERQIAAKRIKLGNIPDKQETSEKE